MSNVSQPTPTADVLRIDIEMIETKNGWKVNRASILQSPGGEPFCGGGKTT